MVERPIVMAVASYTSMAAAAQDFDALCEPRLDRLAEGQVAAALVDKGDAGRLAIVGHGSTAGDAELGKVLLAAALIVVAAPIGMAYVRADERPAAEWTHLGAVVGHFWHHVGKADLRRMSDLLEATQAGLVIVSIGTTGNDVATVAPNAATRIVTESDAADVELATSADRSSMRWWKRANGAP